jgi:hypothetical protein
MRLASLAAAALALLGFAAMAWARTPIPTDLTIKYDFDGGNKEHVFSGKVKSEKGACFKDRKVILYAEDDPDDPQGNDSSAGNGKYQIRRQNIDAMDEFFTRVKTLQTQGDACKAARSEKIEIP